MSGRKNSESTRKLIRIQLDDNDKTIWKEGEPKIGFGGSRMSLAVNTTTLTLFCKVLHNFPHCRYENEGESNCRTDERKKNQKINCEVVILNILNDLNVNAKFV